MSRVKSIETTLALMSTKACLICICWVLRQHILAKWAMGNLISMSFSIYDHAVAPFLLLSALLLMPITRFSLNWRCFGLQKLHYFSLCYCLLRSIWVACMAQWVVHIPFWGFLWSMWATAAPSISCVGPPWLVSRWRKPALLLCPLYGTHVAHITCNCKSSISVMVSSFIGANNQ